MLKHICFANEKTKAANYRMISFKCGEFFFPNTLGFLFFINEEYLKSAPVAKGGGGAIQFSAEIMVNRATWRIVECIHF